MLHPTFPDLRPRSRSMLQTRLFIKRFTPPVLQFRRFRIESIRIVIY